MTACNGACTGWPRRHSPITVPPWETCQTHAPKRRIFTFFWRWPPQHPPWTGRCCPPQQSLSTHYTLPAPLPLCINPFPLSDVGRLQSDDQEEVATAFQEERPPPSTSSPASAPTRSPPGSRSGPNRRRAAETRRASLTTIASAVCSSVRMERAVLQRTYTLPRAVPPTVCPAV
jgi:hypothetical protein